MNDFDDELRRLLRDDRLALTPRTDAVGRIVKGAHRRRTIRLVASAAGSVGLVAAVAIGSMAVTGQFSAGPAYEPKPVESPTTLPGPPITPVPDDDPAVPVLDPVEPFDGVQVRMTLAELEAVPGVEITRLRGDSDRPELCYGEFRTERAHGYISLRGAIGGVPEDQDELMAMYEVATLVPDVPVQTPEGIGVGSPAADVWAAYPETSVLADGSLSTLIRGLPDVMSYWHFEITDDRVSWVGHDALHNCGDDPRPFDEEPDEEQEPELPVFDPAGLGPIRIGLPLAELEALDGVQIDTEYQNGRCYGTYTFGDTTGWISARQDLTAGGDGDAAVDEELQVTTISSDADLRTPEGIRVGSTLADVRAAYPGLAEGDTFDPYVAVPGEPGLRWIFNDDGDGLVSNIQLDGGQICAG